MCMFLTMRHWTINRQSGFVLLGVLIVIVLVMVLPQIDLLDTAFQRDTAPIVLHARGTTKPLLQIFQGLLVFFLSVAGVAVQRSERPLLDCGSHQVQVLNHCFRC